MAKPKPVRILSDDCEVTINGEIYTPHEGEWVETMVSAPTVRDQKAMLLFQSLGPKVAAAEGDDEAKLALIPMLDQALDAVCATLASRVTRWNWTDDAGNPFPRLDGSPDHFRSLRDEEVHYLLAAVRGETPGQRKND
jgi:hypothetical protein